MIDKNTLNKIHELLDNDKFKLTLHAEEDILKQNYNWSKSFIKECLKRGKIYYGKELYPNNKERWDRYYCIHKYTSIFYSRLILIAFLVFEGILIIHIQPLNKESKEGKVYSNL